jgi:hypothetical protein
MPNLEKTSKTRENQNYEPATSKAPMGLEMKILLLLFRWGKEVDWGIK